MAVDNNLLIPEIEEYSELHSSSEPKVLQELYRETNLKVNYARMLSGHLQGGLLKMICSMIQPKQVLEIGTFTGYSAISMAMGIEDGMIHTIDNNPELEDIALRFFKKAGVQDKIQYYSGDAAELIPTLDYLFDLVFIDADKENYSKYFDLVIDKVRSGGFILGDNVLWDGKALKEPTRPDKETRGIRAFNDYVHQDERVENLLLPFRDGLMIMRKK